MWHFFFRYDCLTGIPTMQKSVGFEKGSVLYNTGALYTQIACKQVGIYIIRSPLIFTLIKRVIIIITLLLPDKHKVEMKTLRPTWQWSFHSISHLVFFFHCKSSVWKVHVMGFWIWSVFCLPMESSPLLTWLPIYLNTGFLFLFVLYQGF